MKLGYFGRSSLVVYVIVALTGAAVLVLYVHHRAIAVLEHQSELLLQKISEVTGEKVVSQIQDAFDGPVLDTLWAPETAYGRLGNVIKAGRVDILEGRYAQALDKYPQIERLFLWTPPNARFSGSGEVLFYDGDVERQAKPYVPIVVRVPPAGSKGSPRQVNTFYTDPQVGREVLEVDRVYEGSTHEYVAAERQIGQTTYVIVIRRFWNEWDLSRRSFALLGFVVNLDHVRGTLFKELDHKWFERLLKSSDGSPTLEMRIFDDGGHEIFGPSGPPPLTTAASMKFPLRFYSAQIDSRMVSTAPVRFWTLVVSPTPDSLPAQVRSTATGIYWLSGLSISLMFVAIVLAVRGIRQVLELSQMQSDFVAHVSHQLKTPLSLVSAASETLSLGRIRSVEKRMQYFAIVNTETEKLSGLVDRILEFSRRDGQHRTYQFEDVNLISLVGQCIDGFLCARPGAGISIALVHDESEMPTIRADAAALEQVLLNLLDNAVRYSDDEKEITVAIRQLESEAILEVTDKGIGISTVDAKHVFDRFYRGAAAQRNRDGFGLGLAIVQQIVKAHQGTIELESSLGRGSTFRVRLPFSRVSDRWTLALWSGLRHPRSVRAS